MVTYVCVEEREVSNYYTGACTIAHSRIRAYPRLPMVQTSPKIKLNWIKPTIGGPGPDQIFYCSCTPVGPIS